MTQIFKSNSIAPWRTEVSESHSMHGIYLSLNINGIYAVGACIHNVLAKHWHQCLHTCSECFCLTHRVTNSSVPFHCTLSGCFRTVVCILCEWSLREQSVNPSPTCWLSLVSLLSSLEQTSIVCYFWCLFQKRSQVKSVWFLLRLP